MTTQSSSTDLPRYLLANPPGDIPQIGSCCDMHNRNCEPPSELCCEQCAEAAHDTFPIAHADGSICVLAQPVMDVRKVTKLCTAEYEREGGRQPGDRIVRCGLPAGHDGDHQEIENGEVYVVWVNSDPASGVSGSEGTYESATDTTATPCGAGGTWRPAEPGDTPGTVEPDDGRPQPVDGESYWRARAHSAWEQLDEVGLARLRLDSEVRRLGAENAELRQQLDRLTNRPWRYGAQRTADGPVFGSGSVIYRTIDEIRAVIADRWPDDTDTWTIVRRRDADTIPATDWEPLSEDEVATGRSPRAGEAQAVCGPCREGRCEDCEWDQLRDRERRVWERIKSWEDDPETRLRAFALTAERVEAAEAERDRLRKHVDDVVRDRDRLDEWYAKLVEHLRTERDRALATVADAWQRVFTAFDGEHANATLAELVQVLIARGDSLRDEVVARTNAWTRVVGERDEARAELAAMRAERTCYDLCTCGLGTSRPTTAHSIACPTSWHTCCPPSGRSLATVQAERDRAHSIAQAALAEDAPADADLGDMRRERDQALARVADLQQRLALWEPVASRGSGDVPAHLLEGA